MNSEYQTPIFQTLNYTDDCQIWAFLGKVSKVNMAQSTFTFSLNYIIFQ